MSIGGLVNVSWCRRDISEQVYIRTLGLFLGRYVNRLERGGRSGRNQLIMTGGLLAYDRE